jgi:hypothetical protein
MELEKNFAASMCAATTMPKRRSKSKLLPPPNVHLTSEQHQAIQDQLWQIDLALDRVRRMLREAGGRGKCQKPKRMRA